MTDKLAAYKARQAGNASTPTTPSHEMTTLHMNGTANGAAASLESRPAFLEETSSVQDAISTFSDRVARIAALNARTLDTIGSDDAHVQERDTLVADTLALSAQLKDRIKRLQGAVAGGGRGQQDVQIRQNRVTFLRNKFMEALQNYRQVEQEHQAKSKQRIERQYRIVKPQATQEEITAVIAEGGDQVFTQALTSSHDYAHARSAFNEVQSRARELRRMEDTLAELAQLFSDMAVLVEQQDETIVAIENNAVAVEGDAEQANGQLDGAIKSARNARRMRWICFIIILVILIVIAIVLAVHFAPTK